MMFSACAKSLNMDSDRFIEASCGCGAAGGQYFPDVLLRMADNESRTCPFLSDAGCTVYPDRPDTCRTFPVEHGMLFKDRPGSIGNRQLFPAAGFLPGPA
jgi:Fe-S-cluster containining protein